MKQALEMSRLPAGQQSWSRRFLEALFAAPKGDRMISPELLSDHVARDIGLGADMPGNPLLRDSWLRR